MTIQSTPTVGASQNVSQDDNKFIASIKQQIALSINVVSDTVSNVRRENDIFYDGLALDRLRPDTNGPRIIANDCQAAVDRVVSQVAKAFFEERSVEAVALSEDDMDAALQATKMCRHTIFDRNDGKILLRDSIKSTCKYPFGGAMRVCRMDDTKFSEFTMYLREATSMDEAEELAQMLAINNTKDDYIIWKLLKVKEEKYEKPQMFEGKAVINAKGKAMYEEEFRYKAVFEIKQYNIMHKILLIPPEELLINKVATCLEDANFIAQRRYMPLSDIKDMWGDGYDTDLDDIAWDSVATSYNMNFSNEKQSRRRVHNTLNISTQPAVIEKSMKNSLVVEGYMRYDFDGDGHAEWRHFAMVDNFLLENTMWDGPIPFILPNINRDPHRPDEITIIERAKDSQLAKTAIMRSDMKAHQYRNSTQIIARMNALPSTGQRKLLEGSPGVIPFGQNEQGTARTDIPGTLAENILVLSKPDPSPASVPMLGYLDQQKGSQVGVNNLNDVAGAQNSRSNPATNAALQQKQQDIAIEDYIMCYGETCVKRLFQKIWWFIVQDATHPCIDEQFKKVTGQSCIDVQKGEVGELFSRELFRVNVGLGTDSPDYQNYKSMTMIALLNQFNQSMSGQTLPNLMPKLFYCYQEATKSLGYDPDLMLLTKDEFDKFFDALIKQQQEQKQQPPPQDPVQMATVALLTAQAEAEKAKAQVSMASIPKEQSAAVLNAAKAKKEMEEAGVVKQVANQKSEQSSVRVNT